MPTIWDRLFRAAKLDVQLYEEVEADRDATVQAMIVVVLAAVAAGIGSLGSGSVMGIVTGTIVALVSWLVWAFLTYFIGTRLLPEAQTNADFGELLRTIGFASAPGVIRVFGIVPLLAAPLFLIAGIWMLVAMVIAVRQALDYTSTLRSVGVCVIGWLVQVVIWILAAPLIGLG
jgi:hypothetical protein